MTKINSTTPPVVHTPSSPTSASPVKQGSSPPTPSSSTPKSPGHSSQFSAPKPAYSDPYAKGKPPSPQQQAAYTTSTKSVGYGGSTQAPPHVFIKQPHVGPDSKLCAYYALSHLQNKELDKAKFLEDATDGLTQSMMKQGFFTDPADARAMAGPIVHDGGDPSLFGVEEFKLGRVNGNDLEKKGGGIVANGVTGHFFTVKKQGDQWVSYDSFNHSAPKKYDSFAALKQAEFKQAQTGVMEEKIQFWVER